LAVVVGAAVVTAAAGLVVAVVLLSAAVALVAVDTAELAADLSLEALLLPHAASTAMSVTVVMVLRMGLPVSLRTDET
jgi:hypothetical protein